MTGNLKPVAFRFNPWKHHLNWLKTKIAETNSGSDNLVLKNEFITNICGLNNNHIDLYTGIYTPLQITENIQSAITSGFPSIYHVYTHLNRDNYELIELKDQSVWVLRKGDTAEPSIHIHPAKYTPHSVRIYGVLLKTCLLLTLFNSKKPDLHEINSIRKQYLNLSPLKKSHPISKFYDIIELLTSNTNGNGNEINL